MKQLAERTTNSKKVNNRINNKVFRQLCWLKNDFSVLELVTKIRVEEMSMVAGDEEDAKNGD